MTEPLQHCHLIAPASTEGLADLFDVQKDVETFEILSETSEIPIETSEIPIENSEIPVETSEIAAEIVESYSVADAQKLLNLPRSTVYRHIQSGRYKTAKGADGKLRILLRQSEIPGKSRETAGIPDETVEILTETVPGTNGTDPPVQTGHIDVSQLLTKLEAATYYSVLSSIRPDLFEWLFCLYRQ